MNVDSKNVISNNLQSFNFIRIKTIFIFHKFESTKSVSPYCMLLFTFLWNSKKAKTRLAQQRPAPWLEPHLRHGLNHRLLDYKADTLAIAIIYIY